MLSVKSFNDSRKIDRFLNDLDCKINTESILFFDMDGTLIHTNEANNLSYKKAIQQIMQKNVALPCSFLGRFEREMLKDIKPPIPTSKHEEIIQLKNKLYKDHLSKTTLNHLAVSILKKYSKTNTTVLVTNCYEARAKMLLEHHTLMDDFSYTFYRHETKTNKFKRAITSLKVPPALVYLFENDLENCDMAKNIGIPTQNIIYFKF